MYYTILGNSRDEWFFGDGEDTDEKIVAKTGDDRVEGLGGNDYLVDSPASQGFFSDQYYGGDGNDIITTNSGNDLLIGGNGDDHFIAKSHDSFFVDGGSDLDTIDLWGDFKVIFKHKTDGVLDHIIFQHDDQVVDVKNVETIHHHFDV